MPGRHTATPRKEKQEEGRKGIEVHRVKHPTLFQATDALTGDEKQNGKQKKTKRKKQGASPQPSYPGTYSHLLRWAGIIR